VVVDRGVGARAGRISAVVGAGVLIVVLSVGERPVVWTAASVSTTGSAAPRAAVPAGSGVESVDPALVDVTSQLGGTGEARGTGITVAANGVVLTNNHVIEGGTKITATDLGDGRTYAADVVGYDRTHDVAVLRLRGASGLPTARLGSSAGVKVGDQIAAVGNAEGRGGKPAVAPGTVRALGQAVTAGDEAGGSPEHLTGLIEVAANVLPGDSGGPLVDPDGTVIVVESE
jgi:S1-C subfamily serine protease